MSYPNLNLLLRAANRRLLLLGIGRALLVGLTAVAATLLGVVMVDAQFALPPVLLFAADALVLAVAFLVLVGLARTARRHTFDAERTARLLEVRAARTDNALINSVRSRRRGR